ncbi:MAG: X-Pro dipeptidyl-peptidase C-terminal domain protein [Gemmatimonadetes bacterium]|nr:X-Pro dipeptidyl-peptidase C-terminal domain protein [Gemmatimonadota bacterium]
MRRPFHHFALAAALVCGISSSAAAQRGGQMSDSAKAKRWDVENELQSLAVVDRKVMLTMRDGVRIPADVYRPKDTSKKYPVIWVRTPYNFNFWDVANGVPRDMTAALTAVKRGYAYIDMQERGHFFAGGNYDILGAPLSDGDDEVTWMTKQNWSNGKVGTTGCSSTAEWQGGVASLGNPGYAAMNVQGFGAGVGRVGGYYEQGNWYRGGAVQMLFIDWLMGEQNQVRPMMPANASQEDLIRASKSFDLAQHAPPVDWSKAFYHLPEQDIMKAVDGPHGIFADSMPVPTGGAMIKRAPNDPAWYKGGLWHDNMPINIPGLWFMSWYDVSVGPNLAMFNHVRNTAKGAGANHQWAVIAPVGHCSYTRAAEHTIVGERDMGDARLNYADLTYDFFDMFLKGEKSAVMDTLPKVRYYTMGLNKWQTSDTWPPRDAQPMTFYLSSGGSANTLNGDGVLTTKAPAADKPDHYTYDPLHPVTSYGGNVCCQGNAVVPGSLDQRKMEERPDILVFTSDPFKEGMEFSGPITPTLYVSSDAKDTDFTVKVIDVYPDGRAYNLDESIQRMRYRDGYDKPLVWMEPGKVYKVALQPLNTSNYFAPGHRLRIEVSSSNFPRFDRNLNTGGNNYDEDKPVVAHQSIHHSTQYPSTLTMTLVKGKAVIP